MLQLERKRRALHPSFPIVRCVSVEAPLFLIQTCVRAELFPWMGGIKFGAGPCPYSSRLGINPQTLKGGLAALLPFFQYLPPY